MTKSFPNPLVRHLLTIADELAAHGGAPGLRQLAGRRAVSTAYYAVFHALCYVCADGLVRWSRTGLVNEVYRALDHGTAKRRLADPAAHLIDPVVRQIDAAFRNLQENRHVADYGSPAVSFTRSEVLGLVERAKEVVRLIHRLDLEARTRLAIVLVISKRAS